MAPTALASLRGGRFRGTLVVVSADPHSDRITVPTEGGTLPVHRWFPASGSGPGALVLQEIFGVSTYIRHRAADLAKAGYVVYVPELYHRITDEPVGEEDLERGMELAGQLPWSEALADARAALDALRTADAVTGGVAIVGFCYGGGLAFNLAARTDPDALVSYYGSALPSLLSLAPEVTAPSLHHFGTDDAYIVATTVEEIRQAVTADERTQFFTYDGAGHAFDNPSPLFHHPQASAKAWQRTLDFLAEHVHSTAS